MPRTRALAEARASPERAAPAVMLPASATCRNNRRSVRSKCIGGALGVGSAFVGGGGRLRHSRIAEQGRRAAASPSMTDPLAHLLPIAATFLLAGMVKGVVGLGLPTV